MGTVAGLAKKKELLLPQRTVATYVETSTAARNLSACGEAQGCVGPVSNSDAWWQQEAITAMAPMPVSCLLADSPSLDDVKAERHTYQVSC